MINTLHYTKMDRSNKYLSKMCYDRTYGRLGDVVHRCLLFIVFSLIMFAYMTESELSKPLKYVGIGILVMMVICEMLRRRKIERDRILLSCICSGILLIAVVFQWLSGLSPSQLLEAIAYVITFNCIAIFGDHIFRDAKDLYCVALCISLITIVDWAMSIPLLRAQAVIMPMRRRMWGHFSHPNMLGGTLMAACAMLSVYRRRSLFLSKKRLRRIALLQICLIIMIYLTDSRTSMISLAVFFAVLYGYEMIRRGKRIRVTRLLVLLLIAGVIGVFVFAAYIAKIETFTGRLSAIGLYSANFDEILFGKGLMGAAGNDNGGNEVAWLTLFANMGLCGVVTFAIVLFCLLFWGRRFVKRRGIVYATMAMFMVGSIGEAFMVNLTNVMPLMVWTMLSNLCFEKDLI